MGKKYKPVKEENLQAYYTQIRVYPLLGFEEEVELSKRIKEGDVHALSMLINSNLRLVVKIARHYAIPDTDFMDIVQEGNLGLIQAAGKYDYRRNVRFCTYASWWIRQFISRYLVNKGRMVRLPHRQEELLRKIQHAYHNLSQTLMRQPKFAEIAEALGVSTQDVAFVLNMSSCPLPLEYETREEESAVVMEIHEDYTYNPERTLFRKFSRDGIRHVLEKLKDREQRIIRYRYQLDGNERFTLKKTGDAMGLSPETIRQIELKALGKIRAHVEELKDSVYPEAM